ncbi:MAG: response regulator [Lachnospiraceae bacterium]|nr:response regulator [Lachnospiraceae bacterium]
MANKVLLIRREETFLVNTIKAQLNKNGFEFIEAGMLLKDITRHKDEVTLMVLYADDTIGESRDTLVYIKDLLLEEEKELIVAGGRNELEEVEKIIPRELIEGVYERPFDMQRIMDHIGDFLDDELLQQRKKMILIVDDDPTYLKLIKEWLKEDYRVGMASSGMQAITWLANNTADLVLLDYEMPTIKGSKVLEMMKSEANSSTIPVMFLTGKSDKEAIMEVLALKPAGYLLKTIDRKTLLDTLEKFFVEQKYKK